ncbi:MAG: hypothetical protein R2852_10140 [Bacteroidia bacterium]
MKQLSFIKKSLLAIVILSIFLISCDKKDDNTTTPATDNSDKDKPVITINTPTAMQIYNSGDTIRIKGMVTDASLHELLIKITKDSDGSELFSETPTVHDLKSYTIDTYWKSAVSGHTNATLVVLAEDHDSNVSSDTVHIHIMP